MARMSQITLATPKMGFSAGHFTVFNATEREALHGHNYQVSLTLCTRLGEEGLNYDYRIYKNKVYDLCKRFNLFFLLPEQSPYLTLEQMDDMIIAYFNGEKIPFLKKDVITLPLTNITIEELSRYFLEQIVGDETQLGKHGIVGVTVGVSNTPGTWGNCNWGTTSITDRDTVC